MRYSWRLGWAALACAGAGVHAAQTLESVTVNAMPMGDTPLESSQPVSVLRGAELDRRRGVSLGDTLSDLPGVTSTGFGTAAGRPVIRGQSGPRVAITDNGLDIMDASSLSPDHAPVVDPLGARQIEVLRGPATLLYGSGAMGGLVNAVSDRIPTTQLRGIAGDALVAGDTASRERLGSVRLRGGVPAGGGESPGTGGVNWTLGAFWRKADDYRIPGPAVAGDPSSASGRLPNSFTEGQGLSGGVSWVDRWGAAGVSYSTLDSLYGIPAEPGVVIDQRNRRTEGLVELDAPFAGIESMRLRAADVRYRHVEVEAATGEVGTAFDSRGTDARLEAVHAPLAGLRGVIGLHARQRTLSASGEEAYIPSTRERENALFWAGDRTLGRGRLELGIRQGSARLDPAASSGAEARSFGLTSFSIGGSVPVAGPVALSVNLGSAQRAPAIEELYANGPHAATGTYEVGNPSFGKERSRNVEVALRQTTGALRWKAGVFHQRFANYIAGFSTDDNGDGVADRVDTGDTIENSPADPGAGEFARLLYEQAPAVFRGFEAEIAWRPAASAWALRGFGDAVRGTVEGLGAAPRTPPLRLGLTADYRAGPWAGFVSVLRAAAQDRIGPLETTTAGYTRLDAELSHTWKTGALGSTTLFVQGRNLTNEEIRLSTSFVKDVVPMAGRSVFAGVRIRM